MKATLTVTSRGVVTLPARLRPALPLPVEIYSEKRIREFDAAEADLDQQLRRKKKPAR